MPRNGEILKNAPSPHPITPSPPSASIGPSARHTEQWLPCFDWANPPGSQGVVVSKAIWKRKFSLHSIHATCLTKPHTPRSISVPGVQMPSSTTVKRVKGILSNRWLGENGKQLEEPSCSSKVQVTQVVHSAESALPSTFPMPSFMKNKA